MTKRSLATVRAMGSLDNRSSTAAVRSQLSVAVEPPPGVRHGGHGLDWPGSLPLQRCCCLPWDRSRVWQLRGGGASADDANPSDSRKRPFESLHRVPARAVWCDRRCTGGVSRVGIVCAFWTARPLQLPQRNSIGALNRRSGWQVRGAHGLPSLSSDTRPWTPLCCRHSTVRLGYETVLGCGCRSSYSAAETCYCWKIYAVLFVPATGRARTHPE